MKTLNQHLETLRRNAEKNCRVGKLLCTAMFCLTAGMQPYSSHAQTINTYAGDGSGTAGCSPNAVSATSGGEHVSPKYVTTDGSGNVYFSSPGCNTVRYISGGTIDVFAGTTGSSGSSGNGGAANAALMMSPSGVAANGGGNVYICDAADHTIRVVTGGNIYAFAGTSGSPGFSPDGTSALSAQINTPDGIVVDGSGNVYFSDQGNNVVRMITPSGNIYTVAGNGSSGYSGDGGDATNATLTSPAGLATDGTYLYVADPTNHVIRQVNILGSTSGRISTWIGTGTAGSGGDCGNQFVAALDAPTSLAFDQLGKLYIGDINAHKVRIIDQFGHVSTFAGTGTAGYTGDGGDATAAEISSPSGLAIDASGNIYIADNGSSANAIRQVSFTSGTAPTTPSQPDQNWFSSPDIKGINTASIAYGSGLGTGTLFGADYYDGATGVKIYVADQAVGGANISVPNPAGVPDIVIGNCDGSIRSICRRCLPARNYILADAYISSGNVVIDFYNILDNPLGPTITITPITGASKTITGYTASGVHIDLIADPNNTGITGRPFCNKYIVVFEDYNSGNPNIYAAYGDLNLGTLSAPVQINPAASYGTTPDVAAVRRGLSNDVALVTYLDPNGNALYYREYDFTAGTYSAVTTLDNGSTSSSISNPRIDAYDDPAISALVGVSQYKVVAQVQNCSYSEIRTYDNQLALSSSYYTSSANVDITGLGVPYSLVHPLYNHYTPTVAVGANSSNDYNVQHFMEYGSSRDVLFMEPIDKSSPSALSAGNYYWVNSNTGTPIQAEMYYPNAISTPANDISLNTLNTWVQYNAGTATYDIKYKLPTALYGFKHNTVNTSMQNKWEIFPNPATDNLMIRSAADNYATSYRVTDMMGRIVLQGTITGNIQSLDISKLTKGNYVIGLYKGDNNEGTAIFAKN